VIGCLAVILCSKEASARQARKVADSLGARAWCVDVDESLAHVLPKSSADRLLRRNGFGSSSDLSLKRNLGLALAHGSNWARVLFLDDDIIIEEPETLTNVAGLLDKYRAVGLGNDGYPDNSVVCHAHRDTGGKQVTFIGGGAMMVNARTAKSFFPNIYNEDWLFLLGMGVPFRAARAGRMIQRAFDPYANPKRAAAEELGDTFAESLFWLLDQGRKMAVTGNAFWGQALFRRRRFISYVLDRIPPDKIRESLNAALQRSAIIKPQLLEELFAAWQSDLGHWKKFLHRLPIHSDPEKFLAQVGLADRVHFSKAAEPSEKHDGTGTLAAAHPVEGGGNTGQVDTVGDQMVKA
jgi:hypothetical protein